MHVKKDRVGLFLHRMLETERSIRVFQFFKRNVCVDFREEGGDKPLWWTEGLQPLVPLLPSNLSAALAAALALHTVSQLLATIKCKYRKLLSIALAPCNFLMRFN